MLNVLYVFGGEKASGAEKVIERLISSNSDQVNAHLFISPSASKETFVDYTHNSFIKITIHRELKKLNRSKVNKIIFNLIAIRNYIFISYKTLRYIKNYRISIVHANTIVPACYLLPAIWFSKIFNPMTKWIWSDHDLKYFSDFDHKLSSLCVNTFDRTLVVSEAVRNKYHGKNSRVMLLYNGLDLNQFVNSPSKRKCLRDQLNISSEGIVIGLAGTIEPRKGQLSLINTFLKLYKQYPEISLVLVGAESSDHQQYVSLALSRINNNESIIYLGKISDMISFYNACDIIVNNSNSDGSEPLGTTIYEAMACQKIVVATRTGGTPEIIDNAVNGYLFNPDNEEELYQVLKTIITNYQDQDHVIKNARLKVEDKFNINLMKENYNNALYFYKFN